MKIKCLLADDQINYRNKWTNSSDFIRNLLWLGNFPSGNEGRPGIFCHSVSTENDVFVDWKSGFRVPDPSIKKHLLIAIDSLTSKIPVELWPSPFFSDFIYGTNIVVSRFLSTHFDPIKNKWNLWVLSF